MNIFEDKLSKTKRYIYINIDNGKFRMDEQDLGPLAGFDNEYERCMSEIDVQALYNLFDVHTPEELIQVIKKEFGRNNGFDLFSDLVHDKGIRYSYYCG